MRRFAVITLAAAAAAAACTGGDRAAGPADVEAYGGEPPIAAPWLREQLPAGTLVYQRIPHPLGLMAMPKGNLLDTALGSDANLRNLIGIQQGLAENLAGESPALGAAPVRLLLDHLRSPIEAAVTGMPAPSALVGATLSLRSAAELEGFFAEIAGELPIALAAPLDADGFGRLIGLPVPAFVHFDAASGRLALYGGQLAARDVFERLLEPAADRPAHPMHALEAEVDSSGHGYFGWVDAAQALQMGAFMLPPAFGQTLQAAGLAGMRALAFGAGAANGKGRLKVMADLGTGGANRPFPVVDNRIGASSVGEPRALLLFSIPSPAEFTRLETLALAAMPPESRNVWTMVKQAFAEQSGASFDEILAAIGPELMLLSDRAGEYFALRARDPVLLDDVLRRLSASSGAAIDERSVAGETIRHLSLPGNLGVPAAAFEDAAIAGIIQRMQNRVYWTADGDYLYLAGIPQLLIDRARIGADTSIADWLSETQRVDLSSSFFAATGSLARVPRLTYQAYLGMMQSLADLAGVDYDIWAMPTPDQLGLPERGALGLSLNLGNPIVSVEMTYETHPADVLYGAGGVASAAMVGVLAAIAIPAYQDYTIRAQVSEGLSLTAAVKAAVARSYQSGGAAPADRSAAGLTANPRDTQGRYVQGVDVDDGQVIVRYGNAAHPSLAGRVLVQTPHLAADGSIVWACGYGALSSLEPVGATGNRTNIEAKHLPSACR